MSKLVPEVRINKNGVAVIKHVNPDKKKTSLSSAPLPALPDHMLNQDHAEKVVAAMMEISKYMQDALGEGLNEEEKLKYSTSFMYLPDDLLTDIARIGSEAEFLEESAFEYDCINLLVNARAKERQYRHFMVLADVLGNNEDVAENGPERAVSLILSMTEYDRVLDQVRGTDQDHSAYYVPLCEATMEFENIILDGIDFGGKYTDEDGETDYRHPDFPIVYKELAPDSGAYDSPLISNPDLVKLFVENIDRKDEIIALIRERHEIDPATLERHLNDSHRSLTDGNL